MSASALLPRPEFQPTRYSRRSAKPTVGAASTACSSTNRKSVALGTCDREATTSGRNPSLLTASYVGAGLGLRSDGLIRFVHAWAPARRYIMTRTGNCGRCPPSRAPARWIRAETLVLKRSRALLLNVRLSAQGVNEVTMSAKNANNMLCDTFRHPDGIRERAIDVS
jgi:hypothetical protein